MERPDSVELNRTDLAALLSRLACQLRNQGLALVGKASLESSRGRQDYEDLAEIWNFLDQGASLLEAIQDRLCKGCQTMEVSECVSFGRPSEACAGFSGKGERIPKHNEGKVQKTGRRVKRLKH